jgi:hypothetical protein
VPKKKYGSNFGKSDLIWFSFIFLDKLNCVFGHKNEVIDVLRMFFYCF